MYAYDANADKPWNQMGTAIYATGDSDWFGYAVSISSDGKTLAAGAYKGSGDKGYVRVFSYDATQWNQMGTAIDGKKTYDYSGSAVSISSDGMTFAVGAYTHYNYFGSNSGYVQVYAYDTINHWQQMGEDIVEGSGDAQFGFSVSISFKDSTTTVAITQKDDTVSIYTTKCPTEELISSEGDTCIAGCPSGEWINSNGESCTKCPTGKLITSDGKSCIAGCPTGEWITSDGESCIAGCPTGEWINSNGDSCISRCPTGEWITSDGVSCIKDCPPGELASSSTGSCFVNCPEGQFLSSDTESCVLSCIVGEHMSSENKLCLDSCPEEELISSDDKSCLTN